MEKTTLALVIFAALTVLAGCGKQPVQPGTDTSTSSAVAPAASAVVPAPVAPVAVAPAAHHVRTYAELLKEEEADAKDPNKVSMGSMK